MAVGDPVAEGDVLLDVTTDKVDVEIPAPAAGVLAEIAAGPGDAVEVGSLLGAIDPSGAAAAPASPAEPSRADGNGGAAPDAPAQTAPAGDPVAILPDMESVTEGTVVEWRVAVGDPVAADDIVVEVSTDKVDLEVPAPAGGVLSAIAVPAGETFEGGPAAGRDHAGRRRPRPGRGRRPARRGARRVPGACRGSPAAGVPELAAHLAAWPAATPTPAASTSAGFTPGTGPGGIIRRGDAWDGAGPAAARPSRRRPR